MSTMRPIVNLDAGPALPPAKGLDVRVEMLELEGEVKPQAWRVRGLLTPSEVHVLCEHGMQACTQAVGVDGILAHYRHGDAVGSRRASFFSSELAARLWSRIQALPFRTAFNARTYADWQGHPCWQANGVNELFRFILYKPGEGELVAHYDAPYVASSEVSSLYTLLLYLTDGQDEGATRFISDSQQSLAFEQRDFSDWSRCAHAHEVELQSTPKAGDALVFEHRLLHDSQPVTQHSKLVIRTDVMFQKR